MGLTNLSLKSLSARKLCFATVAIYLLILFLSSCSQTPRTITTDTPPQFENLALITSDELPVMERPKSHMEHFRKGTVTGAASGAVAGTAIGLASCDDWLFSDWLFALCVLEHYVEGLYAGSVAGRSNSL